MKNKIGFTGMIVLSFVLVGSFGCQNPKQENASKSNQETLKSSAISTDSTSNLLAINCYICHDPGSSSHDDLLAPPLAGIKKRYMNATGNRAAFIERMSSFAFNPTKDAAMMKGPIKRFGLMPKTALDQPQIEAIVKYIYDNEIPAPSWFGEHEKQMHKDQKSGDRGQ
jgi:hypothetical protein